MTNAGDQVEDLPRERSMQTTIDKMALRAARGAPRLARAAVRVGNAIERRRAAGQPAAGRERPELDSNQRPTP